MLTKKEVQELLNKINNNKASNEDIILFNKWYDSFDDSKTEVYETKQEENLQSSIWHVIKGKTSTVPIYKNKYFRIAAAMVILGSFALYTYTNKSDFGSNSVEGNIIVIEGNSMNDMVLTSTQSDFLDSTKFINLSALGQQNKINKISTGKGQFIKLQLPDGSKVSLSAGSQLHLSDDFQTAQNRVVHLNGEAYFEVVKTQNRSFTVLTKNQEIQVLGTKFNVKAYDNQKEIITSLLEGSIKLNNGSHTQVLQPNEIAITSENNIEVKKERSTPSIGWRTLNFEFENENIEDVFTQLGHWYNVKMIFNNAVPTLKITGKIPRGTSIEDLQIILQHLTPGDFKLKNKELHITFNNN